MATSVSEYVDYEEKDGVGIWKIEDFPAAIEAGDMKAAEQHYVETASDPEMQSVVVTIGGVENMDSEVLEHVEEEWTAVAAESGVDFTAYVADGIARLSISQKNEAEDVVTKGFNEFEPALEWAKEKRTS
jgi:protein-disulfide isomerase-like protein with CxxC motif